MVSFYVAPGSIANTLWAPCLAGVGDGPAVLCPARPLPGWPGCGARTSAKGPGYIQHSIIRHGRIMRLRNISGPLRGSRVAQNPVPVRRPPRISGTCCMKPGLAHIAVESALLRTAPCRHGSARSRGGVHDPRSRACGVFGYLRDFETTGTPDQTMGTSLKWDRSRRTIRPSALRSQSEPRTHRTL